MVKAALTASVVVKWVNAKPNLLSVIAGVAVLTVPTYNSFIVAADGIIYQNVEPDRGYRLQNCIFNVTPQLIDCLGVECSPISIRQYYSDK